MAVVHSSDGEVKRSEPVKLQPENGSCCGHLVVIKMNNTFQSAVIHYSSGFTSGSTTDSLF